MNMLANTGSPDATYRGLYKAGAAAAFIAALIFRRNLDAEWMLLRNIGMIKAGPVASPSTVVDWFNLLQSDRLLGLTFLNLFDIINYVLVGLIFLALCVALRQVKTSLVTLAATLSFFIIVIYLTSNQALTMLTLSNQYAASTGTERTMLLAAGQAVLAIHSNVTYQGTGLYPSFLLVSLVGLILSAVMLRSTIFSKGTAYMGILANSIGLGYYIALAFAPALVFIPLSISAIFLLIWYILIGLRLYQLGHTFTSSLAEQAMVN